MQHSAPAPALAPLACGQTLTRAFAAGDELFCASGTLQLNMSALAGVEAMAGLQLRLQAGQSWRAPAPLRLQIMALGGPAQLRCSPAPAPLAEPASPDWRARVAAFFSTRRTLRT
ncbi:MAG: hypothetical protein RR311_09050 [Comamonas sp.]